MSIGSTSWGKLVVSTVCLQTRYHFLLNLLLNHSPNFAFFLQITKLSFHGLKLFAKNLMHTVGLSIREYFYGIFNIRNFFTAFSRKIQLDTSTTHPSKTISLPSNIVIDNLNTLKKLRKSLIITIHSIFHLTILFFSLWELLSQQFISLHSLLINKSANDLVYHLK